MKAIILAAGRGNRMGYLTDKQPKCLIKFNGKPLIEHQISSLKKAGIKDIAIVTGYKSEFLKDYGDVQFHNPLWSKTNMLYSLLCAEAWLESEDCIISYSDIYYSHNIVKELIKCSDEIAIAYDPNWLDLWSARFNDPLDDAETFQINSNGYLTDIGKKPQSVSMINGQYMGLFKLNKKSYLNIIKLPNYTNAFVTDYLSFCIQNGVKVKAISNNFFWYEIDTVSDIDNIDSIMDTYKYKKSAL